MEDFCYRFNGSWRRIKNERHWLITERVMEGWALGFFSISFAMVEQSICRVNYKQYADSAKCTPIRPCI